MPFKLSRLLNRHLLRKRLFSKQLLRRLRLALWGGCILLALVLLFLAGLVARTPLPEALASGPPAASVRVLDRQGRLLDEYRPDQGRRAGGVQLKELPEHVLAAVLAAEDARFYQHPGFDPLAILRAILQAAWHRRWVSGASTITQQLARNVAERPRTLRGKLNEIVLALRIERELDKATILEEYLNRIEYTPHVRGLDAASRLLFDKPARKLDLAEAALLSGLPRGPSLYNPFRGTERAQSRRDRILARMAKANLADQAAVERALQQPVMLQPGFRQGGAEHLVRAIGTGRLLSWPKGSVREARTTLDGDLQAVVQGLARQQAQRLQRHDASGAAVLVIDNATREVLAYVGAPDFWSDVALGQNDGTRALRQPGSALKPFVYASAIESLGYSAATLLPDIELHLPTPRGDYMPRNYDGRFRGPVRLRPALAGSLNVPAVYTAQRVGPERVLTMLHRFGFLSLDKHGAHYGAAIALGDGEVTLAELAAAYAALANDGSYEPLRFVVSAVHADGEQLALPERPLANEALAQTPSRRAIAAPVARLITDILSDTKARQAAFGRGSALELPFPVAVKTGTSKGSRDNWTIGYTKEVTVAVWVGNFDGRPMQGTSGITGAGPLFREVMLAAMRNREPQALVNATEFTELEICALSGHIPTDACPHRQRERFITGHPPRERCSFHERVLISRGSGLRATPACSDAEEQLFEVYPESYAGWARRARRPFAPTQFDPQCPDTTSRTEPGKLLSIAYPVAHATFTLDPGVSASQQQIVLRAGGARPETPVWFVLDGKRLRANEVSHDLPWTLQPGLHRLHAEAGGVRSDTIEFRVEPTPAHSRQ